MIKIEPNVNLNLKSQFKGKPYTIFSVLSEFVDKAEIMCDANQVAIAKGSELVLKTTNDILMSVEIANKAISTKILDESIYKSSHLLDLLVEIIPERKCA